MPTRLLDADERRLVYSTGPRIARLLTRIIAAAGRPPPPARQLREELTRAVLPTFDPADAGEGGRA